MKHVTRKPEVWRDLVELADYLAEQNPELADRFIDAAEATFHYLVESPDVGNPCHFESPEAAGIRRWHVKGFPNHLIFYRPIGDGIDVVRVLHAARDIESLFDNRSDD
jgi:toxin ParE1/3/4